jgi:hypothetical protein
LKLKNHEEAISGDLDEVIDALSRTGQGIFLAHKKKRQGAENICKRIPMENIIPPREVYFRKYTSCLKEPAKVKFRCPGTR